MRTTFRWAAYGTVMNNRSSHSDTNVNYVTPFCLLPCVLTGCRASTETVCNLHAILAPFQNSEERRYFPALVHTQSLLPSRSALRVMSRCVLSLFLLATANICNRQYTNLTSRDIPTERQLPSCHRPIFLPLTHGVLFIGA